MDPITVIDGAVSVLDRDDVDTDQIIPKQFLKRVERTGFGEFLFYDWAKEPGLGPAAEPDPRDRAELRLRLVARARAVGARGLRLQGDRRAVVRRHLLRELHQDRAAAGPAAGRRRARRSWPPAAREVDLDAQEVTLRRRAAHASRSTPTIQPPPAQRPRRHRADAAEGRRDRRLRAPSASAPARSRRRSDAADGEDDRHRSPATGSAPRSPRAAVEAAERASRRLRPSRSTSSAARRSTRTAPR